MLILEIVGEDGEIALVLNIASHVVISFIYGGRHIGIGKPLGWKRGNESYPTPEKNVVLILSLLL